MSEPVAVFLDPDDTLAHAKELERWSCLEAGTILVKITPGPQSVARLMDHVLAALGKRLDLSGAPGSGPEAWLRALAWLGGERVDQIVVTRAHLLRKDGWDQLVQLAAAANARLVLIAQTTRLPRGLRQCAKAWDILIKPYSAWQDTPPPPLSGDLCDEPVDDFPEVPVDEFPTFLAACRESMDRTSFRRAAAVYWHAHRRTKEWHGHFVAEVTESEVVEYLRALCAEPRSLPETLVTLRGAQAALFVKGALVSLDVESLAAGYSDFKAANLDAPSARRLRQLSHPQLSAAAVVSLASSASPKLIAAMELCDVTDTGSEIWVDGGSFGVPIYARGLLRAHCLHREMQGATEESPLFVAEKRLPGRNGTRQLGRATQHAIQLRLRQAGLETGLILTTRNSWADQSARRWLGRRGIKLQMLDV